MIRVALSLSLLALAAPSLAQDTAPLDPEQIGEIFCTALVDGDMAPVGGLLTPELAAEIAAAEAKDAEWAKANPGEKPPLGDGIPWQMGPDYAADCTARVIGQEADTALLAIAHGFPDYPEANYVDGLSLKLVPDSAGRPVWRIDNVVYPDDADLRSVLAAAFAE